MLINTTFIPQSAGYLVLYDSQTGEGVIALKGLIGEWQFKPTNIYQLGEEGRDLATSGSIQREVSQTEFESICELAKKYEPVDWLRNRFTGKEFPGLAGIVEELFLYRNKA